MQLPHLLTFCQRRYGDRFTIRMGTFGTYVYLTDPADIRAVFHGDDAVFHAGEANAPFLSQVLGRSSVLCIDDDEHARQRRRLSGPFHGSSIAKLVPLITEIASDDIATWPVGEEFAVLPHMQKVTLEVILRAVIGLEPGDPRLAQFRTTLSALVDLDLVKMMPFVFPALSRYWPWTRYEAVKAAADKLVHEEISRCRRDPRLEERSDVLAMLVRHREPDGSAMESAEIRDQLVTLLAAGHETTATGLAWTFERLTRNPGVLEATTRAAVAGDDGYLDAVVTESLRSRPVVPDITRKLVTDVEIGEGDRRLRLPAGVFVDPAIYLVMRSAVHYPNPEEFRPERFIGKRPDPTVWLPFGGGSRRCIGAAFALTEMRVVLSEVLQRMDLAPTRARPERPRVRHVTLAPHRGARLTVRSRRRVDSAASALAAVPG